MVDKEEKARFGDNFAKARTKNNIEENFLRKQLSQIDKNYRKNLSSIEHDIYEEKKFATKLKQESDDSKRLDSADMETITNRRNHGLSKHDAYKDDQMSVSGRKMSSAYDVKPTLMFWSQDASTKLPVMTSFYGYRLSFQRSMTEIKLLGQQTYPASKRETQSADQLTVRDAPNVRKLHTSGSSPRFSFEDRNRDEKKDSEEKPLPTRGKISLNCMKSGTGSKLYPDKKPDTGMSAPEDINLDLKQTSAPSFENVPNSIDGGKTDRIKNAGQLMDPRRARRRLAMLNFKTREEATKSFRDSMLSSKHSQRSAKPLVATELDRSYSQLPILMSEVTRLNKNAENDKAIGGKQYTKSAFALNMQCAVSKKVLNNSGLPVAFRKNHSTYLKHYGAPLIGEKTPRHYNTPDTLHTPMSCMTINILDSYS